MRALPRSPALSTAFPWMEFRPSGDLDNFEKIAFKIGVTNPENAKVSINGLPALPVVDDAGVPLAPGTLPVGVDGVFKYRRREQAFYYLGQYQVFGEAYDENPDSPFTITRLGRELPYVFEGDDYDSIYSNDLASQRARYEIYNHTVLSSSLDLDLVAVPWLDVNQKISYVLQGEGEEKQYIIKSISGSTTEATMSAASHFIRRTSTKFKRSIVCHKPIQI